MDADRLSWLRRPALGACLAASLLAPAAHAALFEDEDARRAILDLRQRVEQNGDQLRARQAEQNTKVTEQLDQLRRSLLDLNNQLELLRADNAKLRGQNEQLARDLADVQRAQAEVQRRQTDIQQGVEERIRKMEPQKVSVDGKEFLADPEEKRQYDDALAAVRSGAFERAEPLLTTLLRRYPATGYRESALFWLGNAQYARREYKEAIDSFRSLVSSAPDNPKAPEALLAIANCQAELKDSKAAKRTIEELVKTYPKSEAAQAGRERLISMK
jgi:tol-pal system protein YbgF